jgi:hypothetical protein
MVKRNSRRVGPLLLRIVAGAVLLAFCPVFSSVVEGKGIPDWKPCLPQGVDRREVVSSSPVKQGSVVQQVTVKDVLTRLKARCKKGKLVDKNGRQIYFYRLIGCWGNPPEDYQQQLDAQAKEIERLKKKYTVIEIPCGGGLDKRMISD